MSIRLLVCDDHEVIRTGLASLLAGTDIEIIGEAASGKDTLRLAQKDKPDVILLDIRMSDGDGLSTLEKLRSKVPECKVVMLSMYDNPTYIARSVALGAADYVLKGAPRDGVQRRLEDWLTKRIAAKLEPLMALHGGIDAKAGTIGALPGEARAIAHRLWENFGNVDFPRADLRADRGAVMRALKPYTVWFGRRAAYMPKLLRPDAASLLALLWSVWQKLENVPALPRAGLTSFDSDAPDGFLAAAGFRKFARRAIRLDMLERLEDVLEKALVEGSTSDELLPKLVSLLGCGNEQLKEVLDALGWQAMDVADGKSVWRRDVPKPIRRQRKAKEPETPKITVNPDSPFAGLAELFNGK